MTIKAVHEDVKLQGLSSDSKPGGPNGATFHVIDTGEIYVCHENVWERDLRLSAALAQVLNDMPAATSYAGKYTEAALAGRLFTACNPAKVATSATLNNTFTGLAIINPSTSIKNLIIHEFQYAMMDSPTADTNLSLAIGPAHSGFAADIVIRCCRWGYKQSAALADGAATITGANGVIVKHIATLGTNITTDLLNGPTVVDLGGQFVIPPGYAIYTDTLLASGEVMLFGFMWEEVDI